MQEQSMEQPISFAKTLPWFICGVGMLFYCYAYFLRISPSMMMDNLLGHFHINASLFGNLTAFYYYAYTPMQLPVGLLIDRYNIRLVLFSACLLSVLGLALFISTDHYYVALLGRFLIGLGSAFAYISTLKLASLWLPPNRFAMMAGLTTSLGMIAAMFSDSYLQYFVQTIGYQQALYYAMIAGVILSGLILFALRSHPKKQSNITKANLKDLVIGLKFMLLNPQMWLIGLIGCLLYLPASVLLDVWGAPYLEHVKGFSSVEAVNAISLVFVGWIISSPVIGNWSTRIGYRRLPLIFASITTCTIILLIFYLPGLSVHSLYGLMFLLGLACGAHPLCFSLAKENYSQQYAGTSTALTNTLIMLGGVIFQPMVGILLDWHSKGIIINGVHRYSAMDYQFALSIIPLSLVVCIILTFLLRETYCRQPE